MVMKFTAVYQKHKNWYLGWVEEIPGANTQGKTLREAKANLKDALRLILKTNKMLAQKSAPKKAIREPINLAMP